MPWRPSYPGERPTLGPLVIGWVESMLASPDSGGDGLVRLTREQAEFVMRWYQLDPAAARRRWRRGVLSRAKGSGRSPLMAMLCLAEAFADVVPDGWDASGRPVGKPWAAVRTPWVQALAVSQDQTRNLWAPLLEMARDGPVADMRGIAIMETFITLPRRGRLEYVTASAVSREGNRPVFAALDQTESWSHTNGGVRLAAAVRRNLGKTGGTSLEAPNAWRPGSESVAEMSYEYHRAIVAGRVRDDAMLFDHREAPADTDLADDASLTAGLRVAYGDSSGHPGGCVLHTPACPPPSWGVDLERIVAEIRDPATDPADARQYYLAQPSAADTAWLSAPEWDVLADPDQVVQAGRAKTGKAVFF